MERLEQAVVRLESVARQCDRMVEGTAPDTLDIPVAFSWLWGRSTELGQVALDLRTALGSYVILQHDLEAWKDRSGLLHMGRCEQCSEPTADCLEVDGWRGRSWLCQVCSDKLYRLEQGPPPQEDEGR